MLLIRKPANSLNGVAFGAKASLALPPGPTYNEIHLITSLTAAQVRQVSITLNGDTIIQVSGADLEMLERYKGNYVEAGVFVIPFTNPNAKNHTGGLFGGLVTLPGENITLEIEIGDGEGVPKIDVVTYQAPALAQRQWLTRIRTHTMQANAEGWNDFSTLPTGTAINLRRVFFKGAVNRLKVERDNLILFDAKADGQAFQQRRLKRFPQDGVFVFDPTMYGYEQADVLNTGHNSEFVFRAEVGVSGAIPILVESVEQLAVTA